MAENEFENTRDNKAEAKHVLRKSIISFLISIFGTFLFISTLNKSKLGENAGVSIAQIAFIVLFFCVVIYAGFLATRNLLLGIRELIISKDKFNIYSIAICTITIVAIVTLIVMKALSITEF